jgi:hypothetical protein
MDYSQKTRVELIALCKEHKLKGYSNKKKCELIELIQMNDKNKQSYTFIEVCAGCGGLSSGFIEAGFAPILLNEINKTFCKTLGKNHPNANIV